jgi:hypothetical protein
MSKTDKLLSRLLSVPADLTWLELLTLLHRFGFHENTDKGGSFRTLVDAQGRKIFLHEPHPRNLVKKYAIRKVINSLVEFGLVNEND